MTSIPGMKESKIMGEGRRFPWLTGTLRQHFPQLTESDVRAVLAEARRRNRRRGGA